MPRPLALTAGLAALLFLFGTLYHRARREAEMAREAELGRALLAAVARGRTEEVEALLDQGAFPDSRDEDGEPALVLAARLGHAPIVEALLKHGANPDIRGR